MGGVWCPSGGVYTYIHTYIPSYLPTYIPTYIHTYHYITLHYLTLPYLTFHTYIPLHYITLPYITLPYITLPYIPYIHTYQHTNIPTYHHHRPQGGGPEEPYHHHRPQGGDQKKNQTILSTHTHWWGGEGGWPTLHHIYICIYIYELLRDQMNPQRGYTRLQFWGRQPGKCKLDKLASKNVSSNQERWRKHTCKIAATSVVSYILLPSCNLATARGGM